MDQLQFTWETPEIIYYANPYPASRWVLQYQPSYDIVRIIDKEGRSCNESVASAMGLKIVDLNEAHQIMSSLHKSEKCWYGPFCPTQYEVREVE